MIVGLYPNRSAAARAARWHPARPDIQRSERPDAELYPFILVARPYGSDVPADREGLPDVF